MQRRPDGRLYSYQRAGIAAGALLVVGVLLALARPSDPWLIPGVLVIGVALVVALYGPGRWW